MAAGLGGKMIGEISGVRPQTASDAPPQRSVTRLVLDFFTTVLRITARIQDGNLHRGLVFLAISHASIEHLPQDAVLAERYKSVPPDALRRPISVNALAQTLSLSAETTRRHVQALIQRGDCVRVGALGVIVPHACMVSAPIRQANVEILAAFEKLLADLRSIGFNLQQFNAPQGPGKIAADGGGASPPALLVTRLVNHYILRTLLDGIPVHGDFLRGALFVTVMSANSRHIAYNPKLAWRYATADEAPPDELRKPVSIRQIAVDLDLPYATAHRNMMKMAADGICIRQTGGWIIPTAVLQRPAYLANGFRIHQWFIAMLKELFALWGGPTGAGRPEEGRQG